MTSLVVGSETFMDMGPSILVLADMNKGTDIDTDMAYRYRYRSDILGQIGIETKLYRTSYYVLLSPPHASQRGLVDQEPMEEQKNSNEACCHQLHGVLLVVVLVEPQSSHCMGFHCTQVVTTPLPSKKEGRLTEDGMTQEMPHSKSTAMYM